MEGLGVVGKREEKVVVTEGLGETEGMVEAEVIVVEKEVAKAMAVGTAKRVGNTGVREVLGVAVVSAAVKAERVEKVAAKVIWKRGVRKRMWQRLGIQPQYRWLALPKHSLHVFQKHFP